jgi:molybdate transport system substrate-binding protein
MRSRKPALCARRTGGSFSRTYSSSDSRTTIGSARDLTALPRIALADPAAVPAGIYAKQWLTAEGVWDLVSKKVIPTLDVRAALASVAAGNVAAAIVYRTDAAVSKKVRVAHTVTRGPAIAYSVAPIGSSKRFDAASKFVAFLDSPAGRAVFERRGFLVRATP